jgi:hypothetical protein
MLQVVMKTTCENIWNNFKKKLKQNKMENKTEMFIRKGSIL